MDKRKQVGLVTAIGLDIVKTVIALGAIGTMLSDVLPPYGSGFDFMAAVPTMCAMLAVLAVGGWFLNMKRVWLYGWAIIMTGSIIFNVAALTTSILPGINYLLAEGLALALIMYAIATLIQSACSLTKTERPAMYVNLLRKE